MQIIGGIHSRQKLVIPKKSHIRPTSAKLRETLFNICQTLVEKVQFLDLFAGVGAIGLEALSRGAMSATFIEKSKSALRAMQANIKKLNEEKRSTIIASDVFEALERLAKLQKTYDIIFADPPYGKNLSDQVLQFVDTHCILEKNGDLFLEDEVQKETIALQTLTLKSSRKIGRSFLRHYVYCGFD